MAELIPKNTVVDALRGAIPNAEWLLGQIESEQGWFRFPPYLSNLITKLKIEAYPLLYQNESAIGAMMFAGFMNIEQLKILSQEIECASPEERGELFTELTDGLDHFIENFEIPKTPEAQAAAQKRFDALTPEEQVASSRILQCFFCSFFPSFYQCLSIMVHGEKLTSLVAQAQAGSDEAFVKAVQIDRRILTTIPYFASRYAKAQDEANSDFYDLLSYRLKAPPYRGKIRYKSLWYALAILDGAGLLDVLSPSEIREICDGASIDGYDCRIQSDKHLSRRLNEFRKFQKRGVITTT